MRTRCRRSVCSKWQLRTPSPFILNARLKPPDASHAGARQDIVNRLGSWSRQFYRKFKTTRVIRTNAGEGGAQHDDAHQRRISSRRRRSMERRGHRLVTDEAPGRI